MGFLRLPKLKIADHDRWQSSQDFEVSEVQWLNHIAINLKKSWLCSFVKADFCWFFFVSNWFGNVVSESLLQA